MNKADNNKYYTPDISEFHIGFEYEWLNENNEWVKEYSPQEISKEGFDEQTYGLRVKYLDEQDIIECGWKLCFEQDNIRQFFIGESREGKYDWLLEFFTDRQIVEIGRNAHFACFIGDIKNKSELKQIMKMLGI